MSKGKSPKPSKGSKTANGTKTPVRGGSGASKSKEWYARYD